MSTNKLLDFTLTKEEAAMIETAHTVCRTEIVPVRSELDEHQEFPERIFNRFKQIGLFQAMFEEEYGGLGLSPLARTVLVEVIAQYCLGVATSFGASTGLAAFTIRLAGTEAQRQYFLPKLASGEWIGSFAVTEPNAGSDILNLSTTAIRKGDRYVLNGTKQWITNAGRADFYCVLARTRRENVGFSFFIVQQGTEGLSFGRLENKLGIRCSPTRQVFFSDVEVPESNLIGLKPNRGILHLLQVLTFSRIGIAALAVGLATGAYEEAVDYTLQRYQFGHRIIDFQATQHNLVDMLAKIEAARLVTYKANNYAYAGHPDASTMSALAKCYASEIAMQIATDALQLHGGYGFVKDCPVEKMFRDAKVLAIYEGTNQILKNQIGDYIQRKVVTR